MQPKKGYRPPVEAVRSRSAEATEHFEPHLAVSQLADGTLKAEDWIATCNALGITGIRLAVEINLPKTQTMIA